MEYDILSINGSITGTARVRASAGVTQELLDEMKRDPSQAQIRRDVLSVMAGTKSPVISFPKTPAEMKTAVEEFKSNSGKYFARKDANGDGKLTKDELPDRFWKKLEEQDAVKDDSVDPEGLLKIYAWVTRQR